jgi:2-dehydropantoate 2-reductase
MSQPYVIVGAGSLGQSFAALLALAGEDVTLLATPRRAHGLFENGVIRLQGAVDAVIALGKPPGTTGCVALTTDPAEIAIDAQVIFTTKGHDLPAAIEAVCSKASERVSWAAGVQNGIVKDDLLAAAFGPERVVAAVTIFGAQRPNDAGGAVHVTSRGATYLGELNGHVSSRVANAANALNTAGIPTEARDDIASVLWSKACNATGVFGVTVLTRVSNQQLFAQPNLMRAYLVLVRETAAVAQAYGVQVGDYTGFPPIRTYAERDHEATIAALQPAAPGAPSYASMTQDLLAGHPLEVEAVFGDIVARAARKQVRVPALRLVRDLIRGVDDVTHVTAV